MNIKNHFFTKLSNVFLKYSKTSYIYNLTIVLSSFFIFNNCKKEESIVIIKFEDELTDYLKTEINKSIQVNNDKVESLQLLKTDSLSESDIATYAANYNNEKLKTLSKRQNQLGQTIEKAKTENQLNEIKKGLAEIKDSFKYNKRISDKIYNSKPDNLKVEYYEYKFLIKTSNSLKKDTVYFYSTKTKKKQLISENELINHILMEKYVK